MIKIYPFTLFCLFALFLSPSSSATGVPLIPDGVSYDSVTVLSVPVSYDVVFNASDGDIGGLPDKDGIFPVANPEAFSFSGRDKSLFIVSVATTGEKTVFEPRGISLFSSSGFPTNGEKNVFEEAEKLVVFAVLKEFGEKTAPRRISFVVSISDRVSDLQKNLRIIRF